MRTTITWEVYLSEKGIRDSILVLNDDELSTVSISHMLSVICYLSEGSATLIASVMTDSPGVRSWYLQVYSSQIKIGETTTGDDFIQNFLLGFY